MIAVESITTKFGTAKVTCNGYWVIQTRKEGNHGKFLHRLLYEDYHKCTLAPKVAIHHKDGNKTNNKISNLELMTVSEHRRLHTTGINNHGYGKPRSDEVKRKISEAKKGRFNGSANPSYRKDIPCSEDLLKEYESSDITYDKLAKKYNCGVSTIVRRIRKARGVV